MATSLENLKIIIKSHLHDDELLEANSHLKQAILQFNQDPEIWFLSGLVEYRLGNPETAINHLERAATLSPRSGPIYFNLALAQLATQAQTAAISSLEVCLSLEPENLLAHLHISRTHEQLGQIEQSLRYTKNMLRLDPDHLEGLLRCAQIELALGNLEVSRQLYQQSRIKHPHDIKATAGLTNVLAKQGEFEQAQNLIDPYIKQEKIPHQIALVFAEICQMTNRCDEAITILEVGLEKKTELRRNQRDSLIALARLYDKQANYDRAFAYYAEANSYKQTAQNFSNFSNDTDNFIQTWNQAFDQRLPLARIQMGQVQPVFIVGIARSGTTLVEQILASHGEVYAAGEMKQLGNIMLSLPNRLGVDIPYPECLESADANDLTQLGNDYLEVLREISGNTFKIVTDKMPANLWNLGLIKRLLPSAIIIHCTRQPMDVCLSNYFTDFAEGHGHTFDLSTMGLYYRQYEKMVSHWQNIIKIPMLTIPYEGMAENPEMWSKKLIEYCNLPWDDSCLQPHKTRRDVVTASYLQVRQPIYTSSIDRWKHYEKHLDPLKIALNIN